MARKGRAIFLVYTDLADERYDEEFNAWYDTEHVPLLLTLPGFLDAARYEAVTGGPRYLAVYELEDAEAVRGPAFKNRLRTPWERRVSPTAIGRNVARVLGTQLFPQAVEGEDRGMAPALQIGRMSVPGDVEAEWSAWYDGEFLPGFRALPGVLGARRYRVLEGEVGYAVVYELEHEGVPKGEGWLRHRDGLSPSAARLRRSAVMAPGSPGGYRRIFPQVDSRGDSPLRGAAVLRSSRADTGAA